MGQTQSVDPARIDHSSDPKELIGSAGVGRVALISNYRPDAQQSMLCYAERLHAALRNRGCEALLLHPPAVLGRLPWPRPVAKWIGYVDKYLIAPLWLRWKVRQADVVHVCDHSNSMYLRCVGRKPRVITCHDLLAAWGARGKYREVRPTGRVLQKWITAGLLRAKFVVCVSRRTEADLRELAPPKTMTIRVIPNVLNRPCKRADAEAIRGERTRLGLPPAAGYLLHVGGNTWYKNRLGAMRIFAEVRKWPGMEELRLVMAGAAWTPEMRQFRKDAGLEKWMIEEVLPTDTVLDTLYSGAEALLFPSLAEGFGAPILEAQTLGCPVITTNRPPMNDVAGEAAIYIDGADGPNAADAARTIVEQWGRRPELREAGLLNAASFDTAQWIDAYQRIYHDAIAAKI